MKKLWIAIGIGVAALFALVITLAIVLNVVSYRRQQKTYDLPVAALAVPTDSATIERGRHLVRTVGACAECHGADLGGSVLINSPLMGRLNASNLTSGRGGIGERSNDDLVRAIRHGVGTNRKSLIFMPSEGFQTLSDIDLAAVISYLRTVPPVDRTMLPAQIGPLARVLHLAVGLPLLPAEKIDHQADGSSAIPGASAEYGAYLANVSGCTGCHGPALAGGAGPGPNITTGAIGSWSEEQFGHAIREGKRPNGPAISDQMPWKAYSRMTDEEVRALHMFVRSLPPVASRK